MGVAAVPLNWADPLPHRPRRILVTGCSGSGKTTVAAAVSDALGVPHHELDALFHGPDWVPRPTFVDEVTAFAAADAWIAEWQYDQIRSLLLIRADLLVPASVTIASSAQALSCPRKRPAGGADTTVLVWSPPTPACAACAAYARLRRRWSRSAGRQDERLRPACPDRSRAAAPVTSPSNDCSRRECGVRVLGVDPGLTRCGLGVVDGGGGRQVSCVAVDVVRSSAEAPIERRLLAIGAVVQEWIERHRPDVVAIERVFSQHNVRTVMGTAQASGVVALLAARAGLPVAFHTPSEVKAAVTGEGRAGKAQVTAMVTRLLALGDAPRPADAADALALAICHCWRAPMLDRMAQAKARSDELARAHRARLAAAAKEANR